MKKIYKTIRSDLLANLKLINFNDQTHLILKNY